MGLAKENASSDRFIILISFASWSPWNGSKTRFGGMHGGCRRSTCGSTKAQELVDILVLSGLAVLCGADGWEDIEMFGKIRLQWLRKFIKLRDGVPSHDTISRVFRVIKPMAFHEAFLAWVKGLGLSDEGLNVIAIDGKSLRRSHDKKHGKSMLHSVAAWSTANPTCFGCPIGRSKIE
jgi:predicted transposase YbfD/YdcC